MWPFTPTAQPDRTSVPPELGRPPGGGVPEPPSGGFVGWLASVLPGWPGPAEASRQAASIERRLDELNVSSGPPDVALPWLHPFVDDHTAETPAVRAAYRRMLADPNVRAAFENVILAVCAQKLKVVPAGGGRRAVDREAADFCRWNLTERLPGGVPHLAWATIGHGLIDGYSLSEKVFGVEEKGRWRGKWPLVRLKPKDVGNDLALKTDDHRNVVEVMGLRYNGGRSFSPSRFVHYRHFPLYDSPVGTSAFRAAYSSWWILDTVKKLRATNAERRAVPYLLGTYQTTSQKPGLEEALRNVRSLAWSSLPEGVKVETLAIAGSADDVFRTFTLDCKHDIFLAIQGAMLQSLEGSTTDGRGSSQVHALTADLRVLHLAACLCSLLNDREGGLIKDLCDLNFAVEEYPQATLSHPDLDALLRELQVDEGVLRMGLPLSRQRLYERYGREAPDAAEPGDAVGGPAPAPPVQAFGEGRLRGRAARKALAKLRGAA